MSKRPTLQERLTADNPHVADALAIVLAAARGADATFPGSIEKAMGLTRAQVDWAIRTVGEMYDEEARDQDAQNGWEADT